MRCVGEVGGRRVDEVLEEKKGQKKPTVRE